MLLIYDKGLLSEEDNWLAVVLFIISESDGVISFLLGTWMRLCLAMGGHNASL